jgi:hypothetical protein
LHRQIHSCGVQFFNSLLQLLLAAPVGFLGGLASRSATWAKATALATESKQMFSVA